MATALAVWEAAGTVGRALERHRSFDPSQPRDEDGKWTDGEPGPSVPSAPKARDKLRLGDRVQLAPGERLTYSSKVDGDQGTVRMAVTDGLAGKSVRLGVGGRGYGSSADARETGQPIWSGNPTGQDLERINGDRVSLENEQEELEAELEEDDLTPERRKEVERRLDEIADTDTSELYRTGATVKLDAATATEFRRGLATALDEAGRQLQEFEALELEVDGLLEERRKLAQIVERVWTDEEDARWDAAGEQIDALRAQMESIGSGNRDGFMVGEGAVSGEWGDLLWGVELDDHSVGPIVRLGVRPDDEPDWELDSDNEDQFAILEPKDAWKVLHQMGDEMGLPELSVESARADGAVTALAIWRTGGRVLERHRSFDPSQPRDDDGRWTDGTPGPDVPKLPKRVDKLGLDGRIKLDPGERLVATEKVGADGGGARLAVVETASGRRVRLGVGGDAFGRRLDGEPAWDGSPVNVGALNRERAGNSAEEDALREEWDDASPKRREEIERRLDQFDEGEVETQRIHRSGATARLDEDSMWALRNRVEAGLGEAERRRADMDRAVADVSTSAEYDKAMRAYAVAHGLDPETYDVVASGEVRGEWGTAVYRVRYEPGFTEEIQVDLAIRPDDEPNWDFYPDGDGQYATWDLPVARRFLRRLTALMETTQESVQSGGTMTTALDVWRAGRVTEGRRSGGNDAWRGQPRDEEGQWTDGPGAAGAAVSKAVKGIQQRHASTMIDTDGGGKISQEEAGRRMFGDAGYEARVAKAAKKAAPRKSARPAAAPGSAPPATTAGDHAQRLSGMSSREEARSYLAGVKGKDLEALRLEAGAARGRADDVRDTLLDHYVGSRLSSAAIRGSVDWKMRDSRTPEEKEIAAARAITGQDVHPLAAGALAAQAKKGAAPRSRPSARDLADGLDDGDLDSLIAELTAIRGQRGGGTARPKAAPKAPARPKRAIDSASTQGHVDALGRMDNLQDAEAYMSGVKGAELEALRRNLGLSGGTASMVRQRVVNFLVSNRLNVDAILSLPFGAQR